MYGQDCFLGMKIRVDDKGECTWQPNRFAGNHGARFSMETDGGIGNQVLSFFNQGGNVRITRDGTIHYRTKDGVVRKNGAFEPADITMPPFDLKGETLKPGMIMTGPFDGELHHWFNGKVWTKNIHGKRCHWKNIPDELYHALSRFKPEGGSFIVTCWGNIAALIQPKPLPEAARAQWGNMAEQERRLLQIKQKSIQMLPIYLGKFNPDWSIELQDPVDYSKPISEEEMDEMVDFLAKYGIVDKTETPDQSVADLPSQKEKHEEPADAPELEDWAEDDDDYFSEGLDLLYAPGEI